MNKSNELQENSSQSDVLGVTSNLLGRKRQGETQEKLYLPSAFRNEKKVSLNNIQFSCFLEALKNTNWVKFQENFNAISWKPLLEHLKLPKLSSNLFEFILKFMELDELIELLRVNSYFRKIIIRTHKWFGLYLYFINLFRAFPCQMKHNPGFECIAKANIPFTLDNLFSKQFLIRSKIIFDFTQLVN